MPVSNLYGDTYREKRINKCLPVPIIMQWVKPYQEKVWSNMRKLRDKAGTYGVPFVSKFFLKDYGSGTNQMGGFVGGAPFLQMADFWTWRIL